MIAAHRVAASSFDSLAAGYGGAEVVRELADSQLSRRLLLLRAIVDVARERQPASYEQAGVADAMALLHAVHKRTPAAVTELLRHPHVGSWLAHCLRRLDGVNPGRRPLTVDLGHLRGIAVAAAIRAGHAFESTVPVLDGAVTLPSLGRAPITADTSQATEAAVHGRSGRVTISMAGRPVTVVAETDLDGDGWQGLRRVEVAAASRRLVVAVEDTDPFRDCYGWPVLPRLPASEIADLRTVLGQAWALLTRHHPQHAAAVSTMRISLVPLRRPSPGREVSAASRHAFGSIGSSIPSEPARFAEILIHEHLHVKLGALMDLVPLHFGPSPILYHAPWRDDSRPIGALLQGAYAHLGVADFWRVRRGTVAAAEAAEAAAAEFVKRLEQVSNAVDTLDRSTELTAAGRRFVDGMAGTVSNWK